MDEDFIAKLYNCRTTLLEVSEKALGPVKEAILPLQNMEAGNIKNQLQEFGKKVNAFRQEFLNQCPYHFEESSPALIDKSYDIIADFY